MRAKENSNKINPHKTHNIAYVFIIIIISASKISLSLILFLQCMSWWCLGSCWNVNAIQFLSDESYAELAI